MLRFSLVLVLILSTTFLISCEDQVVDPQASSADEVAVSSEVSSDMLSKGNNNLAESAAADEATLGQQLNLIREVTRKYRDLETARADGYVPVSPYVPGMGFHFANTNPPFGTDIDNPLVLVYYTNGSYNPAPGEAHDAARDDALILGAVEYLVLGDQTESPPNIFADEQSHRRLKVTEENGWHYESAEGFTGLHAWIHRGNPAGVFHPTNPNIN